MKTHSQENTSYLNANGLTSEYIETLHQLRDQLLYRIQRGDRDWVANFEKDMTETFNDKELNILNRVPNNKPELFTAN